MRLDGGCHCGNVSFTLDWGGDPDTVPARACGCTFCTRHGAVWTASPTGRLSVRVAVPQACSPYAFGTGTAVFHVCSRCGVVPVVTTEIDGRTYAVVNVRAMPALAPSRVAMATADFDGEDVQTRLARRAKGWIPDVTFTRGA